MHGQRGYFRDPHNRRLVSIDTPLVDTMGDREEPPPPPPPQEQSMRQHLNPTRHVPPSPIVYPRPTANHVVYTIKPNTISMLPAFYGMKSQCPYDHVRDFLDLVNTLVTVPAELESARMKLFPFSLKDNARTWLSTLKPQSITSWEEMHDEFLKKYYPVHKTVEMKKRVSNFAEKPNEPFFSLWERFKNLLAAVPHHGFTVKDKMQFFYEGISQGTRQFIDTMCNGEFLNWGPQQCYDFLEQLAENNQLWDYSDPSDKTYQPASASANVGANQGSGERGKFVLKEQDDLNFKLSQLTKKLENLELKSVKECVLCVTQGHSTDECPTLPGLKEILHGGVAEQAEVSAVGQRYDPFSNTYNSGTRDHPNFGWGGTNQGQVQRPLGLNKGTGRTEPNRRTGVNRIFFRFFNRPVRFSVLEISKF